MGMPDPPIAPAPSRSGSYMPYTRLLMGGSALLLGVAGVLCTFAPDEVLRALGAPVPTPQPLLLMAQVGGALLLGFAALNWMGRGTLVGGIYSRPAVIANLTHFLVAGPALARAAVREPGVPALWAIAGVYVVLAVAFGIVLLRHPLPNTATDGTH
jgi:hypothetical protein